LLDTVQRERHHHQAWAHGRVHRRHRTCKNSPLRVATQQAVAEFEAWSQRAALRLPAAADLTDEEVRMVKAPR
jgi:hypothetical protein